MRSKTFQFLKEKGYIELDPSKSIDKQAEVGDVLISSSMYIFKGFNYDRTEENLEIDEVAFNDLNENEFTILNISCGSVIQFASTDGDPDDGWFEPEGFIFIKKKKIEYVTMEVPSFHVETIMRMGGRINRI